MGPIETNLREQKKTHEPSARAVVGLVLGAFGELMASY